MSALWRRLVAILDYLVPSDERLEADTMELRAFAKRVAERRSSQGSVLPFKNRGQS